MGCAHACGCGHRGSVHARACVKASCMHVQVDIEDAPLGPKGTCVGIEGAPVSSACT